MDFEYLFKYIVVGDAGVGKTCILHWFSEDKFDDNTSCTLGIEFVRKEMNLDNKSIMIQVWDTAGQEELHSLTWNYFRSCCAVLLVYDITKWKSFENLIRWLNNVKENSLENVRIILIGNKNDLEYKREVLLSEGKAFAK